MTELHHDSTERTDPGALRVLAVTSFRPEEIRVTAAEMSASVEVISVEPTAGRLGHVVELFEKTARAIHEHDPDVILLDCYETMGIVVALLARRHGVPLVARLVGDTWRGYEQPAVGDVASRAELTRLFFHRASLALDTFIFDRVEGFVTVSNELRGVVCRRTDCPPERVAVVPVPVTLDPQSEGSADRGRETVGLTETRVLLTVTNLTFPEKFAGVRDTLEELAPLLESDQDLAYVIAGGGRFLQELRELLENEYDHLADRIYVPGFVERVADLYAAADVFVYVSYRDGFPNAVLEAQTAGLPVVANAAHGMVDQITDGNTGYLVAPGVDGQLRARVTDLLDSRGERQRLGEQARRHALSENAPAVVAAEMEAALAAIVDRSEAPEPPE